MFMFNGDIFHKNFYRPNSKKKMKQWSRYQFTADVQANKPSKLNLLLVKGRKSVTTNRKVCSSSFHFFLSSSLNSYFSFVGFFLFVNICINTRLCHVNATTKKKERSIKIKKFPLRSSFKVVGVH